MRGQGSLTRSAARIVRFALAASCLVVTGLGQRDAAAAEETAVRINVAAGDADRVDVPVLFPLPEPLRAAKALRLTAITGGEGEVPVQLLPGDPPTAAWLIRSRLAAGEARDYQLAAVANDQAATANQADAAQVTCVLEEGALVVRVGQAPVLRYNATVVPSPPGIDPLYQRSGHIHPLLSPSGRSVTGDFPADHPHQHGIFFAWVNTSHQGRHVDFWNQAGRTGGIEHVETLDVRDGPVLAQFRVRLRHNDLTADEAPHPVLDETWTVRVWNFAAPFLVDLISEQTCISASPLLVQEYHYGGMAIRGNDQWFDATLAERIRSATREETAPAALASIATPRDYLTSEGKTWVDGNATRARWVEMHGPLDGQPAGVVVMGAPDNFRAPQPVRLHPHKPYFCFAPMIPGDFELRPGESFRSRYRYVVHDGPADAQANNERWRDYAQPPTVTLVD